MVLKRRHTLSVLSDLNYRSENGDIQGLENASLLAERFVSSLKVSMGTAWAEENLSFYSSHFGESVLVNSSQWSLSHDSALKQEVQTDTEVRKISVCNSPFRPGCR